MGGRGDPLRIIRLLKSKFRSLSRSEHRRKNTGGSLEGEEPEKKAEANAAGEGMAIGTRRKAIGTLTYEGV